MHDLDDVYDYVREELKQQTVITIDIRRLLKYVDRFDRPKKERPPVEVVHACRFCAASFSDPFPKLHPGTPPF